MIQPPPDKFDWTILLIAAVGCALAVMLTSCGSTRDETKKEVQVEQTVTRTGPVVADTPVGQITIQPATVTVERHQTTDSDAHASVELRPSIPPGLAPVASGLLGLVPGIGGILAAGIAMWSRSKAVGALKSCVDGIESFKGEADTKAVDHLHDCLSKRMDKSHKDLIRKVKA